MTASTWTWLGINTTLNDTANWSLTSGSGNAKSRPQDGDTALFTGAGVAPQFIDTQLSATNTLDLTGTGRLVFLNDTTIGSTTSIGATVVINATGTATSIQTD